MKKDTTQNILINLLCRRKKKLQEREIMKKNHKKLSLVERNAYEEIIKRSSFSWGGFFLTKTLLTVFVFAAIFALTSIYFYGNGLFNFKELFEPVFRMTLKWFFYCILFDILMIFATVFSDEYHSNKLKRKLLLKQ